MSAHLFIRTGPNSGEVHVIREAAVVGRGERCDVRLADPLVSRHHFRLDRKANQFVVTDLGSRNGTLLNGVPVVRRDVRHGDEIRAGSTRCLFTPGAAAVPADPGADEIATALPALALEGDGPVAMLGSTPGMRHVFEAIETVAPLDATVLITGESGTGKELVARAIHRASPRARAPLVTVNCAAIPRDLVESELFGHERGAFTGAISQRLGKFELARGGTLFLDEVGELPLEGQAKLLRSIEERKIARLGGEGEIAVDVRIVAATNRDLRVLTHEGRFRADLLYRLEVVSIRLPALRERRPDIAILAPHFLAEARERIGGRPLAISDDALAALAAYEWPGNVRELRNVLERAAIFAAESVVEARDIPLPAPGAAPPPPAVPAPEATLSMGAAMREQIARALAASGGSKAKAARLLGIPRTTLYEHLRKLGLR